MRLYAWYCVCAALLIGHVAWFVALRWSGRAAAVLAGGHVALGVLVIALAGLLITTPADAIRLRRPRSERLIVAGAIALQLAALLLASPHPSRIRIIVGAFMALAGTVALLWILRWRHASAWAAALFAWNPLVVYGAGLTGGAFVTAALFAAIVVVAATLRRR